MVPYILFLVKTLEKSWEGTSRQKRRPAALLVVRPDPGALAAVAGAATVGLAPTIPYLVFLPDRR